MNNSYTVKEPMILMDFIINVMERPHKKAKTLLTKGCILVDGVVVTKYNYPLLKGNIVSLKGYNEKNMDPRVKILYEDKDIIVVKKPAGMLTISTDKEQEKTLFHIVSNYVKVKNKFARIFVIHRLDKETSGIIMFAKSEEIKKLYQDSWEELAIYRGYAALVEGKVVKKADTIINYIKESDDGLRVFVSNKKDGKKCITSYKVIKQSDKYSLLDINIKTGRKNQIRVTMENIGHPIVSDHKYGSRDKSFKTAALCAYKLDIKNPITKKVMNFKIDYPTVYRKKI